MIFYELPIFSGGGLYDDGGHGIKIGSWIEISDRFKGDS